MVKIPKSNNMANLNQYRIEIDGLRAVSVISVIAYHFGILGANLGYLGVDVFFIISGYVISKLLFVKIKNNEFSFSDFYAQRARRLFPALFITLFLTSIIFTFSAPAWMIPEFTRNLLSSVFFLQNMNLAFTLNYFSAAAESNPLLHIWSLCVEEQFYLIWPCIIYFVFRFGLNILFCLVSILIFAVSVDIITGKISENLQFYTVITRSWQLDLGSLVFYIVDTAPAAVNRLKVLVEALQNLAFIVLIYILFIADEKFGMTDPFTLKICISLCAALLLLRNSGVNYFIKILSTQPIVYAGRISYGLYLYHWPVFVLYQFNFGSVNDGVTLVLLLCLIFILSHLSFKYIETPLRYNVRINGKITATTSAFLAALILCLSVNLEQLQEYSQKLRLNSEDTLRISELIGASRGRNMYANMFDEECKFWFKENNAEVNDRLSSCSTKYGKAIAVVGDSHAMNVYNAVASADFHDQPFIIGLSSGGCRITSARDDCVKLYNYLNHIVEKGFISEIIYHQSGHHLLKIEGEIAGSDNIFREHNKHVVVDVNAINEIAFRLSKLNTENVDVIFLGPFSEARVNLDHFYALIGSETKYLLRSKELFNRLQSTLIDFFNVEHRFKYVGFEEIWEFDNVLSTDGKCVIFQDKDHLSECGEIILGNKLSGSRVDPNNW